RMMWTMFSNNPNIDQQVLIGACLERLGVKHSQSWLRPPEPKVPGAFPDMIVDQLISSGASPQDAQALVGQTLQAALEAEQSGVSSPYGGASGMAPPQPQEAAPA